MIVVSVRTIWIASSGHAYEHRMLRLHWGFLCHVYMVVLMISSSNFTQSPRSNLSIVSFSLVSILFPQKFLQVSLKNLLAGFCFRSFFFSLRVERLWNSAKLRQNMFRLLALGADPNYVDPEKHNSPLHIAAKEHQALQVFSYFWHSLHAFRKVLVKGTFTNYF